MKLGQGIFNLSSQVLSESEKLILDQGLKFAPPKGLDKFHTFMDIHKFVRKLNIKRYMATNTFYNQVDSGIYTHSGLSNASLFNPPGNLAPSLKVFRDVLLRDLDLMEIKKARLNKAMQEGLDQLCTNKELVVRPVDKGGGIVVLDRLDYLKEMNNILGDHNTYSILQSDPKNIYKRELEILVTRGFYEGILTSKERLYLIPVAPRTPTIYYLPKLHKDPVCPPGRPIVSGIDSVTSRVGRYVDFFLQPLVKGIPSYVKDSRHIINLLSGLSPKSGMWMVTIDVTSLYTIIPHELGFEAVFLYLSRDSGLPDKQVAFIMSLLRFATSSNYFWFEGKFYKQETGVAMGAKYAPSLANLFMAKWEEDVIYNADIPELTLWARYIDDILLLWDGPLDRLEGFMSELNLNQRGIQLKFEASQSEIHYLDLNVRISGNEFSTSTFFKVTDRNSFIPLGSCHHNQWLKAVPKSQYLRLRRNCSDPLEFSKQAKVLTDRFLEKGYDKRSLDETLETVSSIPRVDLLIERPRGERDQFQGGAPFITSYSIQHGSVKQLINKHWHLVKNDPVLKELLPERSRVIFKGAPSLRNRIAPNILNPPCSVPNFLEQLTGFYQCRRCRVCSNNSCRIRRTTMFESTATGKEHCIKPFITCGTTGVVYLLQCPCGLQYVGRTKRPLRVRLNEHITNILTGFKNHSVSKHYLLKHNKDPSNTLFLGIDKFKPNWRGSSLVREISKLEMAWIHRLKCYTPHGLNIDTDVNAFINNA